MLYMIDKVQPYVIEQLDFDLECNPCAPNPMIRYPQDELLKFQQEFEIKSKIQDRNTEGARQLILDECLKF